MASRAQQQLTPVLPLPTISGHNGAESQEIPPDMALEKTRPPSLPSLTGGKDLPAGASISAVVWLGEALAAWYLMRQHGVSYPCTSCPPQPTPPSWGVPPGWWVPQPKCEAARIALRHLFRLGIQPPKSLDQSPQDSYDLMLAIRERTGSEAKPVPDFPEFCRNLDHELALAGQPA